MDASLVAKYLTELKEKSGLTYEAIAKKSGTSPQTVKNLCLGKSDDPRIKTVAPVTYALDGSIDEMITGKRIENSYNEQHHQETIKHYEIRLADKDKIIEQQEKHNTTLVKENRSSKILAWICVAVLVGILILEVSNPNLGWIRF